MEKKDLHKTDTICVKLEKDDNGLVDSIELNVDCSVPDAIIAAFKILDWCSKTSIKSHQSSLPELVTIMFNHCFDHLRALEIK